MEMELRNECGDPVLRQHTRKFLATTPYCNDLPPNDVAGWCKSLRNMVLKWVFHANKHKVFHNSSGDARLIKMGIDSMAAQGIVAFPTDKDGGFCALTTRDTKTFMRSVLGNGNYTRVLASSINDENSNKIQREYSHLCNKAEKVLDIAGLAKKLRQSWWQKGAKLNAVLAIGIKTHKSPVTVRDICVSEVET